MKSARNILASVRQRLLNRAKTDRRPFNELLQYYAMERFLYRFSLSVHADRFILKGALMLRIWRSAGFRPTMDIDMLGITSNWTSVSGMLCIQNLRSLNSLLYLISLYHICFVTAAKVQSLKNLKLWSNWVY